LLETFPVQLPIEEERGRKEWGRGLTSALCHLIIPGFASGSATFGDVALLYNVTIKQLAICN